MGAPSENVIEHRWEFAGPVARAFELSRAPVAAIEGPTGGGKSTASSRRCLRIATWQEPSPKDGIRKARTVCICPTYRRAWDQVIPSFGKVFPLNSTTFKGSRGDPADFTYDTVLRMGGEVARLHIEVLFRAVQDLDVEDFFRGFEFTAFWLPEADTNGRLQEIISLGSNRVGRYPDTDDRTLDGEGWSGGWCDANAPVIGSEYHDRFHLRRLSDKTAAPLTDRLYRQPSGFSPQAENMKNLRKIRRDFYEHQASQLSAYDRKRLLENRPGFSRHGEPVHPNFDPDRHVVAGGITVDPLSPVYISIDAGSNTLHPAAVFWQKGYGGQWKALDEIHVAEGQMNNALFCQTLRQVYEGRFASVLHRDVGALICIDPAAASPNAHSEYSTAMEIQALTGIEVLVAPSNQPDKRRSALDRLFLAKVSGNEEALAIDARCVGLIGALSGGWHYPRRGGVVGLAPVKNVFSHVGDAAEYGPLTIDGMDAREGRFIRPDGPGGYDAPVAIYAD